MAPKSAKSKILFHDVGVVKRTSIGGKHRPKNKHKRKNFKKYRGQGR